MGLSITATSLLSLLLWGLPGRTQWLDYETVPASPELVQELERFWSYGRSPPVYPARTSSLLGSPIYPSLTPRLSSAMIKQADRHFHV